MQSSSFIEAFKEMQVFPCMKSQNHGFVTEKKHAIIVTENGKCTVCVTVSMINILLLYHLTVNTIDTLLLW